MSIANTRGLIDWMPILPEEEQRDHHELVWRGSRKSRPGPCAVTPWPNGINAITLFIEDLAATKAFYRQVFGLPLTFEDDVSAVFDFGNTIINLLQASAAPELIEPARV